MIYKLNDPRISGIPARIDWLMRYEPVLNFIITHPEIDTILDYGCGPLGLGSVYAGRYFGIDLQPLNPIAQNVIPINGIHPFELKQEFDLVCAMDVLEHIPFNERKNFWETLRRITKRWAILGIPTNHLFDLEYLSMISTDSQATIPDWLLEHLSHQMPDDQAVMQAIEEHGFHVLKSVPQLSRMEYYIGMLDHLISGEWKIRLLNDIHKVTTQDENNSGPDRYRKIWLIEVKT